MTGTESWEILFQAEINQAEDARTKGNEGMARVCARRAVGIVLGEYFRRENIAPAKTSAYDRMRQVEKLPDFPGDVLSLVRHFLVRINPDYSLPIEADLIDEAKQIRETLLEKSRNSDV